MYPFSPAVTPAVRSHLNAQAAFFNDISKSLSHSFQHLCELNIQLSQTLIEEGSIASQQMLTTENPTEAIGLAASRSQPAADKLRAYQQHISRIVADAHLELARVTEQHSQVTMRTARELADQVAQVASEETEKNIFKQQEMMKSFRDPFQYNGAAHGNTSVAAHGNLQSANGNADMESQRSATSIQGSQSAQQAGGKASAKSN